MIIISIILIFIYSSYFSSIGSIYTNEMTSMIWEWLSAGRQRADLEVHALPWTLCHCAMYIAMYIAMHNCTMYIYCKDIYLVASWIAMYIRTRKSDRPTVCPGQSNFLFGVWLQQTNASWGRPSCQSVKIISHQNKFLTKTDKQMLIRFPCSLSNISKATTFKVYQPSRQLVIWGVLRPKSLKDDQILTSILKLNVWLVRCAHFLYEHKNVKL